MQRAITVRHYEQVLDAALRNLDLDLLFPELLGRIRTMLEADEVTVFLLDEAGRNLYARSSVGLEEAVESGIRIPVGQGIAGQVIASRHTQALYDVNENTVSNPVLIAKGIQSLVAVPLIVGNDAIGVVTAGCVSGRRFQDEEVRLLEIAADRVGFAIERTRILRQVTVEREKAERANRFKTTLLHMASHDIKTPLTTMKLQLTLLGMEGTAPETKANAVAMVQRNITRLELTLDDFLDLARIEAGRLTLQLKPVDLRAVADEVVQMFAATAASKKLDLRLTGTSVVLDGDERRLTQVLVNLVSNAIRYTQHGSVLVTVGPSSRGAGLQDSLAKIVVQDTGQGMTSAQIERLFQPFGQVHEDATEGTGLGLHLSKVILDAHGATIRAESPGPDHGTSIIITLPLHLAPKRDESGAK